MNANTKQGILEALREHRQELAAFGVKRCGVFGSYARGQARPDSDIDILVEFEPEKKSFDNFMGLAFYLEELLERTVDLVTTESLSPYIGPHILREVEYAALGA